MTENILADRGVLSAKIKSKATVFPRIKWSEMINRMKISLNNAMSHFHRKRQPDQKGKRRKKTTMQISGPSVTSLLNSLEKNGLIIRRTGSEDGRTMQIDLTEKATYILKGTMEILHDVPDVLLAGFSEGEKGIFLDFSKRVYENVGNNSHL